MKRRILVAASLTIVAAAGGADLLACGDKFLVVGRGTRYQRPKDARPASVLIYARPSSSLATTWKNPNVESTLKREGHRLTTAETSEQLSAILSSGRFDVVLTDGADASEVEKIIGPGPDAPVVLTMCDKTRAEGKGTAEPVSCSLKTPAKAWSLLEAIDKAVELHDQNVRKAQVRT